MYAPVGLSQYEGMNLNGFGTSSTAQVNDLQKALSAGYARDHNNLTGGNALRVESLEESLKILSYSDRHLKMWPKLFKSAAYSTVEEYNQLLAYGDDNFFPWLREGELPVANDSTYQRRTALVKYLGTTREVTHQAALVHPAHGDLFTLENLNGILWLLRQIEYFLFKGNSTLAFNGQAEQFDGLDQLITASNYLDLEGSPLQEADFEEIGNTIAENFGFATDVFLGFRPGSDFVKTLYPRHRYNAPIAANTKVGQSVTTLVTQGGDLAINSDIFLQRPPTAPTTVRGPAASVPTAPASVALALNAVVTTGEFDKSQGADTAVYGYRVSACNRFGESVACAAAILTMTGANAALGRGIDFTITNALGLTNPPEFFRVYRTLALPAGTLLATVQAFAGSAFSLIAEVRAASQAAGGVTPAVGVNTDLNITMPFTEVAYVGELTPQVFTFRQLAPLMKIDLAVLAPAYRWMILMYGVPILFAPSKWARITNIGRLGA